MFYFFLILKKSLLVFYLLLVQFLDCSWLLLVQFLDCSWLLLVQFSWLHKFIMKIWGSVIIIIIIIVVIIKACRRHRLLCLSLAIRPYQQSFLISPLTAISLLTEQMNLSFCRSVNMGVSMTRIPLENVIYESLLTSQTVLRFSCTSWMVSGCTAVVL